MTYSLAQASRGVPCKSSRSRASVCLGKKTVTRFSATKPPSSDTDGAKDRKEELFFIVSTAKNVEGVKYKVHYVASISREQVT